MSLTLTDLTTITPMESVSKYIAGSLYGVRNFSKAKSMLETVGEFSSVSKGLGFANLALTAADMFVNPEGPQIHHGIDLLVGGLSIAFPVFGIVYGIADITSSILTHKRISEHIQDAIKN